MTTNHFEVAYWSVLNELTAPQPMPRDRLQSLLPNFEQATGDRRLQGRMLVTNLLNVEWDWPAWYSHAPKGETLAAQEDDDFAPDPARVRLAMAQAIAGRIANLAYNLDRRAQLLDPAFMSRRPIWRFDWCGERDENAPRACQEFGGKRLHVDQARSAFPKLPCSHLNCGCEIFAER